jgi:O-acetyl-ADP-ribose deacetylase (regulator of RNase III)
MELIFVDKDMTLIDTYRRIIGPTSRRRNHQFICCDINNAVSEPTDYIVSPANSYGIMNGGIDGVYMLMFPGIERKVRGAIRNKYPDTKLLPIGECLSVPITEMRRCKTPLIRELICCPTMEEPCDIRDTDNVYQAMRALLIFLKGQKRPLKVIIPGLGTATGHLSFDESARQIKQAIDEI